MPGLVGIISRQKPEDCKLKLKTMLASMQHENFYSSGIYSHPKMSVYVGWTSHPKSMCDCLPASNLEKDKLLFLTGEVFDDQNCTTNGKKGCKNDIDRLIRLYGEVGENFIENLNGWFGGLLLDVKQNAVFLFNDRYGMHRIFVHEGKDAFYFSSEAKALLAALPELRSFDLKGIGEFLTCGCTLGRQSLYKGMHIFPPGGLWTFAQGALKRKRAYFDVKGWTVQQRLDAKQFLPHVIESFGNILKKYAGGVLPVGISLTGGLDSRMVMACLEMNPGEYPCYTFGSMYRDTFDVKVAREVAKACKQSHHVLVLGEEFLQALPYYLEKAVYISDGYIGLSGAAELYVNVLARNIAPVRLTGNYGGELLRGVRAFKHKVPKGGFVSTALMPYLEEAQTTFQELEKVDAVTFALFNQAPSQGYGRLVVERSQVVPRTPFMDNDLVKMIYQAPPELLVDEELSTAIIARCNPDLLEISTDRGLLGGNARPWGMMRKFYREALIKSEYIASHGMPNWLATVTRFGIREMLERSFLGRDKFQHFRLWSQTRLSGYIMDLLLHGGGDLEEFFNRDRIESMVSEHLSGRQNYIDEIDKLMTITLAYRSLLKGSSLLDIADGAVSSDTLFAKVAIKELL